MLREGPFYIANACSLFFQIGSSVLWAMIGIGVLFFAGSQMLHTFLLLDCDTAIPGTSICTARESYRLVYALMRGKALFDEGEWSRDAILIVSVFSVLCLLWIAAVLLNIVMLALRLDPDDIAAKVFWEPQLSTMLAFGLPQRKTDVERAMQQFWNRLTNQQSDEDDDHDRAFKSPGRVNRALLSMLSIFIIPLWFLVGSLTLGWLWPPQTREWLFRPRDNSKVNRKNDTVTPNSQLSQEVRLTKMMFLRKSLISNVNCSIYASS